MARASWHQERQYSGCIFAILPTDFYSAITRHVNLYKHTYTEPQSADTERINISTVHVHFMINTLSRAGEDCRERVQAPFSAASFTIHPLGHPHNHTHGV